MTGQELVTATTQVVQAYETQILALKAEIVTLKANQLPTGIFTLTVKDIQPSQVNIT